jgi:hypothetical protein
MGPQSSLQPRIMVPTWKKPYITHTQREREREFKVVLCIVIVLLLLLLTFVLVVVFFFYFMCVCMCTHASRGLLLYGGGWVGGSLPVSRSISLPLPCTVVARGGSDSSSSSERMIE